MKKTILFLSSVALILVGCAKVENEVAVPEKGTHQVTLKAYVDEADTRISVNTAGKFSWQAGDQIVVLTDDSGSQWVVTEDSGETASFDVTLTDGVNLGYYAFYPAAEGCGVSSDNEINFGLKSSYDYVKDATNMPMLGTISSDGVSFKAVGGVLKMIVYNVPQSAASFEFSVEGKQITGDFTVVNEVIATTAVQGTESVAFNFAGSRTDNMVFYIPLPTGDIGAFTISFYEQGNNDPIYTKTADANLTVGRNKLIIAPALNAGGAIVDDATLSNGDIIAANLPGSYPDDPISYTNTSGTWAIAGIKGGNYQNSGNWFVQIRNNAKLSYIKLPVFDTEISSIVLKHTVKTNEDPYPTSESVYFRSEAVNSATTFVAKASRSDSDADITLLIPSGYKTGYIMSSTTCLIESIIVKFNGGTPVVLPVITYDGNDSRTIGAGKLNCNIVNVKLENPLDDNGIAIVIDSESDWIASAQITEGSISEGNATLTITAGSYNHGSEARTGKVYIRATGAAERVITVSQTASIVNNPTITATAGNATFSVSWTGDSKVASYVGYYSATELETPTTGTLLSISNEGNNYTAVPSQAVDNGTTYYVYVKAATLTDAYDGKYAIADGWSTIEVTPLDPTAERTAIMQFGNSGTKINSQTVTGTDNQGNTWTVTTVGTTSFTQSTTYSQVGKKDAPATSITFTTTLPEEVSRVNSLSIKLGGFSDTAGTVTLRVGETVVGLGSLNGTNDVTVTSAQGADGRTITITVTNIARGVKVYNITTEYQ